MNTLDKNILDAADFEGGEELETSGIPESDMRESPEVIRVEETGVSNG